MTTLVLLDTNTYLRLAKRVRPFVGLEFGQVPYVLIRDIYEALEANGDLTRTWREAKHKTFTKIFGSRPGA